MIQSIFLILLSMCVVSIVSGEDEVPVNPPESEYFHVEKKILDDGQTLEKAMIVGPPSPPPGYEQRPVVSGGAQEENETTPPADNVPEEEE